ncbi:MAG TPA: cytochrome c [Chitinophagales bacterium]|nr:cytochrome c [Chitinophagales bacterium]
MKKLYIAIIVLLVAVASCTKKSASTAAAAPDGAKIFAGDCARCHGAQGVKDSRTPNLQTIALDKTGLIQSITKGKGHMPAFEDKLSAAEIAAVADLIVSWHK